MDLQRGIAAGTSARMDTLEMSGSQGGAVASHAQSQSGAVVPPRGSPKETTASGEAMADAAATANRGDEAEESRCTASDARMEAVLSPVSDAYRLSAYATVESWLAGLRSPASAEAPGHPTAASSMVDTGGAKPWIAWQTPSRIVLAAAAPSAQRAILKDALLRNLEANAVKLQARDMNVLLALPMEAVLAAITGGPSADGEAAQVLREHLMPLGKRPGSARRL